MSLSDVARRGEQGVRDLVDRHDVYLIIGTMLVIYAAYVVLGVALGFDVNGQVNALVRLTFLIAAYSLAGLALNLHWGYTGLFNVGVAGFMAVGVYAMGMATAPVNPTNPTITPGLGLPVILGILLGTAVAGFSGLVAALPALRLRSDYLAIVTIGLAEIIRLSLTSRTLQEFTLFGVTMGSGGNQGLNLVGDPSKAVRQFFDTGYGIEPLAGLASAIAGGFGELGVERQVVIELAYVIVLILLVSAVYWTLARLGKSPFGRVLKAIREDEDVAKSLGKDVHLVKIKSFVIGAALLGLAGIFWQGSNGLVTPSSFVLQITVFVWIVVILGGSGSNTGTVMGAILFVGLLLQGPRYVRSVLSETVELPRAPATVYQAGEALVGGDPIALLSFVFSRLNAFQFVILGAVLIYLVQRRPQGVLGHRKETASLVDLESTGPNPEGSSDEHASSPSR